ncbi:hypothetical protein BRC98_01470, partial [Halobacteriales archaeon QS_7_68_65]
MGSGRTRVEMANACCDRTSPDTDGIWLPGNRSVSMTSGPASPHDRLWEPFALERDVLVPSVAMFAFS